MVFPTIIFSGADNEYWSEETYRVRIPGSICCYGLLFYGINKAIINNRPRFFILSSLGGLPILIQGFRSLSTLAIVAVYLLFLYMIRKSLKNIMLFVVFLACTLYLLKTDIVQYKIREMQDRNEQEEFFSNKDYIRWAELDYYWNKQCPSIFDKIFGGGIGDGQSSYTKKMAAAYRKRLFWDDLGVVGLGLILGYPTVFVLISMYIICIWRCKKLELQYIRFTLCVVLLGSLFTTAELFRMGNILLLSLFIYIEHKSHIISKSEQPKLMYGQRK